MTGEGREIHASRRRNAIQEGIFALRHIADFFVALALGGAYRVFAGLDLPAWESPIAERRAQEKNLAARRDKDDAGRLHRLVLGSALWVEIGERGRNGAIRLEIMRARPDEFRRHRFRNPERAMALKRGVHGLALGLADYRHCLSIPSRRAARSATVSGHGSESAFAASRLKETLERAARRLAPTGHCRRTSAISQDRTYFSIREPSRR